MTIDPNQLRRNAEYIEQAGNMTVRDYQAVRDYRSAADAFETQGRRIAELEAALLVRLDRKVLNDDWRNRAEKAESDLIVANDRIAELEINETVHHLTVSEAIRGNAKISDQIRQTSVRIDGLVAGGNEVYATVRRLAKALNFYGDPGDYKAPYTAPGGPLYMDCGMTARQALNDPTVKRILEGT